MRRTKNVTWSSSDETVATVDGGAVTAVAPGTANIFVTTADGDYTATCEVTVTEAGGPPTPAPTPPSAPGAPVDRSSWGTPYVREADGVTQYVVEDPASPDYGMTSVELVRAVGSAPDGIFWLHESSGGTSAWYGLDINALASCVQPVFGGQFYVQWLSPGDAGYAALYAQLDDDTKQQVERNNGWLFNMGIRAADGTELHSFTDLHGTALQPVVYVQIGDDWDVADLNAYYIASGADEKVPVDYLMIDYPEGTDTFGRMTLDHFSPYFIFDALTDDERIALTPEHSGPKTNVTTGDQAVQVAVAGLGMTLVLALGIMLRLITNKRKFEK